MKLIDENMEKERQRKKKRTNMVKDEESIKESQVSPENVPETIAESSVRRKEKKQTTIHLVR